MQSGRSCVGGICQLHRQCAVLVLVVLANAACTSWRMATVVPDSLFAHQPPSSVRVTRPDSSMVVLDAPVLRGDTLSGSVGARPIQIARVDVAKLETRQISVGKTAGLVVGVAAAALLALVVSYAICSRPGGSCYDLTRAHP